MRAIIVEHQGEQGSFRSMDDPQPLPNEVVIRVVAAGINPVDWKLRDLYDRPRPFILGQDFAGIVVGVGERVQSYAYGERVFGIARNHGAYAELTVCPVDDNTQPLAHIPDAVGDSDAAGVPTPGLTAMACFEQLPLSQGAVVVIVGASGSVGQIAVQLARKAGFRTVGIGSARAQNAVQAFGAQTYIAHDQHNHDEIIAELRRIAPNGFDAVLDFASDRATIGVYAQALREHGTLISTNRSVEPSAFNASLIRALNVNLDGSRAASHEGLRCLGKMLESGDLVAPSLTERSFDDAVQALEFVKTGRLTGKVVVTFPS